jgi:hypothetical protein
MRGRPIIIHGCHCRFCQRVSGSAFAVNVMIEADRLELLADGAPEPVETPSALPEGQRVYRCPRCRLALWSNHARLGPAIALVNAGAFDDATLFAPEVHCHTASKHPWVALPDGVPAFAADYDHDRVWSDAVKARLSEALSVGPEPAPLV